MSKDTVISVKNVSKSFRLPHEKADTVKSLFINPFNPNRRKYEIQHALKDISFDIKEGEFFGIVGRNGSGKSTLLKIIAGIYQPNSGKISVNGRLVPFIELGVGFNPQLTGRENVYLNGALLGFSEAEVDRKYDAIVNFAELERFMDQKLRNYSSGMQVRLAFSVATVLADSDILLIDEVLAVGDADFQRKCFGYFKRLKKESKTVIFVTHDMGAVREYCDRAMIIDNSMIKEVGSTEKIAQEYLKMFNDSVHQQEKNGQRWGNGQIRYTGKPTVEVTDTEVIVTVEYCSKVDVDNVICGFVIENQAGEPIMGTNSKIINKVTEKSQKNNTQKRQWRISNIFSSGDYILTATITSGDGATIYDWWGGAVSYRSINQQNTPYVVSPRVTLLNLDENKS